MHKYAGTILYYAVLGGREKKGEARSNICLKRFTELFKNMQWFSKRVEAMKQVMD
jgi:hypothetical protein